MLTTFRHDGDRGDIIYSLPVIRYIGGGTLYIGASSLSREKLTPDKWLGLDRIIKEQPYIKDVLPWKGEVCDINLNAFREVMSKATGSGREINKHLADWMLDRHNVPRTAKDEAWIQVQPNPVARVVFARSGAGRHPHACYHNWQFPWHAIWQKYGTVAVFIGTPAEYDVFCAVCGEVPFYKTADLYEAAAVIQGCDLFVGNQSAPHALAEAMKKRIILEVWRNGPNCLVFRPDVIHGWDHTITLPDL